MRCKPEGRHPDQRFVEEYQRVIEEGLMVAEDDELVMKMTKQPK